MNFLTEVIAKLINAEFQGHTSFKVADNKAVGDNPVRELHLDAVPVNDDQSIVSLAWDGGNKLFEKTLPSEEAKHNFELISSDMSEAVSLTSNGKIDEAKKLMESLVNKYSEQSGEMVPTNIPPVTTTQASSDVKDIIKSTCPICGKDIPNDKDHLCPTCRKQNPNLPSLASKDEFDGLWKTAKVSLRNIFPSGTIQDLTFDSQEELSSYQEKMKSLSPQDRIPLWDSETQKGKSPEGEESTEIAPPSLSYDQIEKEKEKEHKNLEKSIDEKIKTEVESALIEKAATVFGPDQIELVEVLRKNGRNWDEIKKILVKDFNFDKEATTIFVDDLRSKEEGTPVEEPMPEMPKPPKELVPDEVHDKLLEDLDKPVDEKKSEPPVKEEKEPGLSPKDIMDIPEEKESSKKCPKCGEDIWDVSTVDQRLNKCWNCGTRFDNPEVESSIERADNAEIRKVADSQQFSGVPTNVRNELKTEIANSFYRQNAPGSTSYRFSLEGNKIYRGEYISDLEWDNDNFGPYQFMYNFEMKAYKENPNYKQTSFASLKIKALNPLQEPPVVEQPTAETSNQDIVPISQTPDHDTPAKGDRVFVMSDLGDEKAGFEGTYVSEYTSKGNQYAIIETDEKDLLDVEMHRVSKVSENTSPEPSIEPNVQKPEEPDIEVTPKMEDLHSSLKESSKEDACYLCGKPSTHSFQGGKDDPRTGKWCDECYKKQTEKAEKESSLESIKIEVKKLEAQLNEIEKEAGSYVIMPMMYGIDDDSILAYANGSIYKNKIDSNQMTDKDWESLIKDTARWMTQVGRESVSQTFSQDAEWKLDPEQINKLKSMFAVLPKASAKKEYKPCPNCSGLTSSEDVCLNCLKPMPKKADVMDTKCEDCGKPLGPEVFLSKHPVCGECTKKKHKKVTGTEKQADELPEGQNKFRTIDPHTRFCEKCGDKLDPSNPSPRCAHCSKAKPFVPPMTEHDLPKKAADEVKEYCAGCGKPWDNSRDFDGCSECGCVTIERKKTKIAADPVPAKTEYKELKKAPDYVDPKRAVPASPDMEQVLVKMESLQNKLSVLDQAKEKIKMAMKQELEKIDVGGERSQIEKELQNSYEKLGILIDATESKVINWSDHLYTLQHQEKEIVPQPTTGELLAKIYAKFDGAERYVESVLNGFKALAKKVQTKRLVQWPDKRSSLEPVTKEASVMDDLNQLNDDMLKALQALS